MDIRRVNSFFIIVAAMEEEASSKFCGVGGLERDEEEPLSST